MTNLSFYQLFRLLRRHRKLADRRDPIFEANKTAKWVVGILFAFTVIYIIMIAVFLSLAANESHRYTSLEIITGILPFILLLDFWLRFIAQQTPSQIIKPYVLMPLPKYTCIDSFIVTSLFNWGNLTWFMLLVPFCLMSVIFTYGLMPALSLLLFYYILILANSQGYSIARTLTTNHMLWWILPVGVSVLLVSPLLLKNFDTLVKFYGYIGSAISNGSILPHLGALLILVIVLMINRRVQYNNVMTELGRLKTTAPQAIVKFQFLDQVGELAEYLKLEVKLLMRNKNPRKSFIMGVSIIVLISVIISLTEVYDNSFMTNFWCIYNFMIFATVLLIKVMNYEGNYIDALMVHQENILRLLTAKYYFFCFMLILPFVLMLPMVFVGKWSILMLFSYAIFTAGFQHFLLMQLAVYNNKAIPLNEKFISKGGMENNYIQVVEEMVAIFLPLLTIQILEGFIDRRYAWLIMMGIGLCFIVSHKIWLRNIYNRMMLRRYKNLESFHS
ncbi:MAG: hypothetical protein I3J02_05890 [Prevotella sp.]|nr:hypothetical protein [Prevotella sp.]